MQAARTPAKTSAVKVIGLTGGIGMGKSNAAAAFRRARIPVFDADAAVHRLQAQGGRAVRAIGREFPGAVRNGAVDRAALRQAVLFDTAALRRLEAIVHPLVQQEERLFLAKAHRAGQRLAVLDIPLLFETGAHRRVDQVVVVSAPAAVQRSRVLARRKMTPAQLDAVIARQTPDAEKRRRADVVIRTGLSRNHTHRQLQRVIRALSGEVSAVRRPESAPNQGLVA